MSEHANDVVDRVRDARRKISERVGHDPDALVRHYQQLDKKHQARLLQDRRSKREERTA